MRRGLLINNNAFGIVNRATAQSKTDVFHGYGVAEAPPIFQAGWSDCMYFLSFFVLFVCLSGISVKDSVLMRVQCRIRAHPR
jgi:hypothetical protein